MEALLASAPTVQSPHLDPDATYKATLVPLVDSIATQLEPSALPKSGSMPANKGQTGSIRTNTQSRRASPVGLFAIFGGVGFFAILGIGVVILILLPRMLRKPVTPVLTPTLAQVLPNVLPTSTPTQTPKPELGFTLVEPQAALKLAPDLKTFTELAVEQYSDASWNKLNVKLIFTVNSQPDVPIVWYWGWCATTDEILQQNLKQIKVVFDADGYVIPKDQLANETYEATDTTYKGWKCQDYLTILRDWKPGTYKLKQTINFSSAINDGKVTFEAGSMFREYNVTISP